MCTFSYTNTRNTNTAAAITTTITTTTTNDNNKIQSDQRKIHFIIKVKRTHA